MYVNIEKDCTYKMIYFPLTMNKAANATVATIQISLDSSKSKHSPWTQTWVLAGHGNVRLQIGFCDSTMILPLPPVPEGPGGGGGAHLTNLDEKVHKPKSKSYGRIGANMQLIFTNTVKLGNKERFDKEQIGIKELFIKNWFQKLFLDS